MMCRAWKYVARKARAGSDAAHAAPGVKPGYCPLCLDPGSSSETESRHKVPEPFSMPSQQVNVCFENASLCSRGTRFYGHVMAQGFQLPHQGRGEACGMLA